MHRHLVNEANIDLVVLDVEPEKRGVRKLARKVVAFLARTRYARWAQDIMSLWKGGWIDAELPAPKDIDMATVVMTVAHGDAYYAAMRYANRHNLPLVTFFHDWWPEIPEMHGMFRSVLERSFRRLYQESSLAVCVGPGMKEELGPHANSKVLHPIPSVASIAMSHIDREVDKKRTFRLLYSGSFAEYGPMLMQALDYFKDHPHIRFEVRGNSSGWSDPFKKEMRECGLLLPYASREDFDSWLITADAFLITQSFDEKHSRLMRTNFPSKLVEFAQLGKPLIIWAPAYASGPAWARDSGQALVVDKADPIYLKRALEELCENAYEQKRLGEAAIAAAVGCFNPINIQSDFIKCITEVAELHCDA